MWGVLNRSRSDRLRFGRGPSSRLDEFDERRIQLAASPLATNETRAMDLAAAVDLSLRTPVTNEQVGG
jgi:hypothetical protein